MRLLEPADYELLRTLLADAGGFVLRDGKDYLCRSCLSPVAHETGLQDVGELVRAAATGDEELRRRIVEAMTVNETSFFRDPLVWTDLVTDLLPSLVTARARERRLDLWCAASASGQEPYSLAMAVIEVLGGDLARWQVRVLATDLSTEMVQRTAAGRYRHGELSRGLSPARRDRFLRRVGDEWVIDDRVRALVDAQVWNLAWNRTPPAAPFDLVLLRNVLVYFAERRRSEVLERVVTQLRPHGRLILGAAEPALVASGNARSVSFGSSVAYAPRTDRQAGRTGSAHSTARSNPT